MVQGADAPSSNNAPREHRFRAARAARGYSLTNCWSLSCALKPSNTSFTYGQLLSFFMLFNQRVMFG